MRATEFRQQQGAVVLKPLDGMGGQGIYVATEEDRNFRSVFDLLSAFGEKKIMMQAYLPAAREADHRVFVVGGKPLDFMLVRTPRADDHRGNLAAGGTGVARPLDSDARRLVESVGADLLAAGVHFAGLDVIGGKLVEVNITCPTGLRQVRDQTGEAVDEAIVGYFFLVGALTRFLFPPFFRFFLSGFFVVLLTACGVENRGAVREETVVFGTRAEITIVGVPRSQAREVVALVFDRFRRLDDRFYAWRPDSETSRINRRIANQSLR